jgi:hypothetical protein
MIIEVAAKAGGRIAVQREVLYNAAGWTMRETTTASRKLMRPNIAIGRAGRFTND